MADNAQLGCLHIPDGGQWSVFWNHSVQGFEVRDIYENRAGQMVLIRSHTPDFAAGLGHIPGRGRQVSDGRGGYWIEDLDEPVPGAAYVLRPGRAHIDHRLVAPAGTLNLSAIAPRERVQIALTPFAVEPTND